jgi:hypothetical protein
MQLGRTPGQVDDHETGAMKALEDLDVHERCLQPPAAHLPRREPASRHGGIDDVTEEALDRVELGMVGCEQPHEKCGPRPQVLEDCGGVCGQLRRVARCGQTQRG